MDNYTTFAITPKIRKRFWAKVLKAGADACWVWQAAKFRGAGYGIFYVDGRNWSAHRVSYVLAHGSIPEGKYVLHTCDNKLCVNPAHLYVGDAKQNAADPVAPNLHQHGRDHGMAKFSEEALVDVRRLSAAGVPERTIAKMTGVSASQVHRIKLAGGISAPEERQRPRKMDMGQAKEIRRLAASGARTVDLARTFSVSQSTVCDIVKGRTWKDTD